MNVINVFEMNIESYKFKDILPSIFLGDTSCWSDVIDNALFPSCHYNWGNVKYQNKYYSSICNYNDLPIIFFSKNKPIAIFPIAILDGSSNPKIVSNGDAIYEPLIVRSATSKEVKAINEICLKIVEDLSKRLDVPQVQFQLASSPMGLSQWASEQLLISHTVKVGQKLEIDLTGTLDDIRKDFRKSYRPLINKGLKTWNVDVIESENAEIFWDFKSLHVQVAGRETRNIDSWNEQYEMLKRGEAFLVTLRCKNDKLVGAGLFLYNSQSSVYASAAYKRDLFSEPLGHVVQFKALQVMKNKNLLRYEIGSIFSEHDGFSKKESAIGKFKSGFSNESHLIVYVNRYYENILSDEHLK